jgi:AcrR family transcriptional regulator
MVEQAHSLPSGVSLSELPQWQLARRQKIVQAAFAALEEQDYEQIQIREVAQRAGVALGTLYRYFSSKEHLYAAVILDWFVRAERADSVTGKTAEQRIRTRVHRVIGAFERHPQFYKAVLQLQGTADPNAKALVTAFSEASDAALMDDLSVLGPDASSDAARILAAIIHTTLTGVIYHSRSIKDVYRLADRFLDLLSGQLAAAETHRR